MWGFLLHQMLLVWASDPNLSTATFPISLLGLGLFFSDAALPQIQFFCFYPCKILGYVMYTSQVPEPMEILLNKIKISGILSALLYKQHHSLFLNTWPSRTIVCSIYELISELYKIIWSIHISFCHAPTYVNLLPAQAKHS